MQSLTENDEVCVIGTFELEDRDFSTYIYLINVLRPHGIKLIFHPDKKVDIVISQDKYEEICNDI